ncbi:MAG: STAS domain-containing protein [Ignavibacteriaceae bacterium]
MFDITIQNGNQVFLTGRFDAAQIEKADKVLDAIDSNCVIDFKEIVYISSAGLGSLLKVYARINPKGNTIKLINMNNHVREVFQYSGLHKVFIIE